MSESENFRALLARKLTKLAASESEKFCLEDLDLIRSFAAQLKNVDAHTFKNSREAIHVALAKLQFALGEATRNSQGTDHEN